MPRVAVIIRIHGTVSNKKLDKQHRILQRSLRPREASKKKTRQLVQLTTAELDEYYMNNSRLSYVTVRK